MAMASGERKNGFAVIAHIFTKRWRVGQEFKFHPTACGILVCVFPIVSPETKYTTRLYIFFSLVLIHKYLLTLTYVKGCVHRFDAEAEILSRKKLTYMNDGRLNI
jgi:hypothetical protein